MFQFIGKFFQLRLHYRHIDFFLAFEIGVECAPPLARGSGDFIHCGVFESVFSKKQAGYIHYFVACLRCCHICCKGSILAPNYKRNQEKNTDGYKNNKKEEKPHVSQYYNFDVPVLIGEIIYTVRLQAEEWKTDKEEKGNKTVHLYNIYETKKSSRLDPKDKTSIKTTREDINNVNKTNNSVNSFKQNEERAKIEFKEKETIITLAKGNDASSFMHELAHLYLHDLQELAKVNKRAEKDLQEVYKILDFDSSADYTEEQFREMHEKFARSFEAYLMNGQAPTEKMKSVFEKFKEFLQEIYHSLMDLEVEFSDEIIQCFDRLFTTDEEYENEVLPMYQQNDELAEQINQQDTFSYKIKNNMNALKETWKSFYDTVIIPFHQN